LFSQLLSQIQLSDSLNAIPLCPPFPSLSPFSLQRIEEAMRQCEELHQQREASAGRKGKEARASTTDPDARVMKFPDGGYQPGYNVQFATDTESGVIMGVDVTNAGSDGEELPLCSIS
jgi:hypothetical protein